MKGERWFEIKWRLTKFPLWRWIFWKTEIIDQGHIRSTWRGVFSRRRKI